MEARRSGSRASTQKTAFRSDEGFAPAPGRVHRAVGSSLVWYRSIDPSEVKYLRLAEEVGLGVSNLRDIDILGEDIEAVRQEFELPSRFQRGRTF